MLILPNLMEVYHEQINIFFSGKIRKFTSHHLHK